MAISPGSFPLLGSQPVTNSFVGVEVATSTSGYVPLVNPYENFQVNNPYWGSWELIRVRIPAGSVAFKCGALVVWTGAGNNMITTLAPNTANQGAPCGFMLNSVPTNASFDQYAWVVISGVWVGHGLAFIASGASFGVSGVGQIGALTAGKQVLSAKVCDTASLSIIKSANIQAGSPVITVADSSGLFVGQNIASNSAIPVNTVIASIDQSTVPSKIRMGQTANPAIPVLATQTIGTSLLFVNNDGTNFYSTIHISRPFLQGQIT